MTSSFPSDVEKSSAEKGDVEFLMLLQQKF